MPKTHDQAGESKERAALTSKRAGRWESATWGDWEARARAIAAELAAAGVGKGDRVAIFAGTREEWAIADVAILLAGGVTVPIYPTLIGEQAAYILRDSGAKVLFVEDAEQLAKLEGEHEAAVSGLAKIVLIDGARGALFAAAARIATTWSETLAAGAARSREEKRAVSDRAAEVAPADLATIIYTSGTASLTRSR